MSGVWRSIVSAVSRAFTPEGTGGREAALQQETERQQRLAEDLQNRLTQVSAPVEESPVPLPDPYAPLFGGRRRQGRSASILTGRNARTLSAGIGSNVLSGGAGGRSGTGSGSGTMASGTYRAARLGSG